MTYPKEGTQAARVLEALLNAKGDWVNGQHFLRKLYLSQFHARIWDLENVHGWKIEHSTEADEFGFRSYRILEEAPAPAPEPPKRVPQVRFEIRNGVRTAVLV